MTTKSLPETSPSPWPCTRTGNIAGFLLGFSFPLARWVLHFFERHTVSPLLALAMLLGVLFVVATGIHYLVRWIAGLDEMQRLIQFKAFALVMPVTVVLVVGNDLVRAGGLAAGFRWDGIELSAIMATTYWLAFLGLWWRNR